MYSLRGPSPVDGVLVRGAGEGVRPVPLPEVAGPQHSVVEDDDGGQRGQADGVDALAEERVHLRHDRAAISTSATANAGSRQRQPALLVRLR